MRRVKVILNYKTGVYPFLQLVSITQDTSLWVYSETKCDDQNENRWDKRLDFSLY